MLKYKLIPTFVIQKCVFFSSQHAQNKICIKGTNVFLGKKGVICSKVLKTEKEVSGF
jgi:hypothetical protein